MDIVDSDRPDDAVNFTDEGFRDGPQSLWGSRMTTQTMVDIAGRMDKIGYSKSMIISGATFEAAVQHLHEDPWTRLDAVTALMPNSQAAAQIRGRTLFGWQQFPDDVVRLFISVLNRHGVNSLLIYEALNDMRLIEEHVSAARELGIDVTIPICISVSPVHTSAHYSEVFQRAADMKADTVSVLDASGLLAPTAAAEMVRLARAAVRGTSTMVEMNVHDLTGRALACYRAGLEAGARVFATVPRAVAYGKAIPAVQDVLGLAVDAGMSVPVDTGALGDVEKYFRWAAYLQDESVPNSTPLSEEDIDAYTRHQIPGGMMSNLVRQLSDLGIQDRLPAILEEVQLIRSELGYPIMVTPCSQMIGVQATINVVSGQRYSSSPTEISNYLRGIYGTPPGKIDHDIMDRVLGDKQQVDPYERLKDPMLPRFRAENGPFDSDEDLLLALMYSKKSLERMRSDSDRENSYQPRGPQRALIEAIMNRMRPTQLRARL